MKTYDLLFLFGVIVVALFLGVGIYGLRLSCHEHQIQITACMKDHKEYECHAMLDSRH